MIPKQDKDNTQKRKLQVNITDERRWKNPQQNFSKQNSVILMSTKSVMQSNHHILCCPLLLPPSIFPRIRVFSKVSALCIRWPKYWSFRFNISPSNEHSGLISFRMHLNIVKAGYDKPTANIIFNGEKLRTCLYTKQKKSFLSTRILSPG